MDNRGTTLPVIPDMTAPYGLDERVEMAARELQNLDSPVRIWLEPPQECKRDAAPAIPQQWHGLFRASLHYNITMPIPMRFVSNLTHIVVVSASSW